MLLFCLVDMIRHIAKCVSCSESLLLIVPADVMLVGVLHEKSMRFFNFDFFSTFVGFPTAA